MRSTGVGQSARAADRKLLRSSPTDPPKRDCFVNVVQLPQVRRQLTETVYGTMGNVNRLIYQHVNVARQTGSKSRGAETRLKSSKAKQVTVGVVERDWHSG